MRHAATAGRLGWRRNFIRKLLGPQISLPEVAWDKLLWAWIGFFLFAYWVFDRLRDTFAEEV